MRFITIFLICLLFLPTCSRNPVFVDEPVNTEEIEEIQVEIIDPLRIRAEEIVSEMDNKLLAAQVLISGIDGRGNLPPHMIKLLTDSPAGGVMLFRYNLDTSNDAIISLLTQTKKLINDESGIPPFIAVDHEGGTVNRFIRGFAALPAASTYWDISQEEGRAAALEKIENDSFNSARLINELGINMNFAPVAEYLIDENQIFLSHRSYGSDPEFTALAAAAFKRGMKKANVLCVVKHFPGSAGLDPHYSASVLNLDRFTVNKLVEPFSALINDDTRAIMTAHTLVLSVDGEIASLSSVVMQKWLRAELGFDGIIISDDFFMTAAGNLKPEEAAIRSIIAGADMVLVWQPQLRSTHDAIIKALADGRLSQDRLTNAAERIIYEKLKMGLME